MITHNRRKNRICVIISRPGAEHDPEKTNVALVQALEPP